MPKKNPEPKKEKKIKQKQGKLVSLSGVVMGAAP